MYKIFKDIKKIKPINKVLLLSFLVLFIISIFEIQSLIKTIGNVTGVAYGFHTSATNYDDCTDQQEGSLPYSYDYYVKSNVYASGPPEHKIDECVSDVALHEYGCTSWTNGHKSIVSHYIECPHGCGDGVCLPALLPIPSCEGDAETCLISYYTFDDNTVDENGVNDAAIMNGVNCGSEGYKGKACKFDGIDDYLALGNPDSLRLTNDLTISAWITILGSTMADQTIISRRMDLIGLHATNILYELSYTQSNNIRLRWNYGESILVECLSDSTVSKNKWHHIAVVRDVEATSSVQLYVDGALKGSCVNLPNPAGGAIPSMQVWIGRNNYPASFNTLIGKIDELKIYNKALSESEINFINSTTLLTAGTCVNDADCNLNEDCSEGICIPISQCTPGQRIGTEYCSASGVLTPFKAADSTCLQNYECIFNACVAAKCAECISTADCNDPNKDCINNVCTLKSCSTIGLRVPGNYCNITRGLQPFKAASSSCNQHYECIDNVCDNSVCKSYTILQQTYCYLLDQLDETDDELC